MADDKPICPLKMTFEELVEMKMKQSSENEFNNQPVSPGALARKQFLKKGEGLTRWVGKATGSPESEQLTPQPNKTGNVRRKIFSASKESSSKASGVNPPLRVPSHVVPPKSPRHLSKAPVKPVSGTANVKRGKQSPVPPSPRSLQGDSEFKLSVKNSSSMPRSISPASVAPPLVPPTLDSEPFLNKPTDVTLCSEKEFEQMEEFLGDHPHDSSICSQASVVRKFMARPSMTAKPESGSKATSRPTDLIVETGKSSAKVASTSLISTQFQGFHDDEAWGPETNSKHAPPEPCIISAPSPSASPDLVETPKRQNQNSETSLPLEKQQQQTTPTMSSVPDPLQPLNDVLRSKIMQLDVEIDKFRTENRRLEERKRDFEKIQGDFIAEKRKFEEHMESESTKFEQFKRQEIGKIKRERAALDQLRTQVHTLASEKNSVELVQLREKLRRAEQESADKEDRSSQTLSRAKEQIKRLQAENEELKRSIEMLERLRIDRNASAQKVVPKMAGADAVANMVQSLRKTLPLKNDARQNCIPQQSGITVVENNNSKQQTTTRSGSNGINALPVVSSATEIQQVTNGSSGQSDKEDERDAPVVNSSSPQLDVDEIVPANNNDILQTNNNINNDNNNNNNNELELSAVAADVAPERSGSSAAEKIIEGMEPAQATLMTQWLKDVNLCLFEDNETCIATLEKEFPDGKVEVTRSDGSRRIVFANGTIKIMGSDNAPVFIRFFNKDMKKVTQDGTICYYYADTQTIQTTFADGLEVMEFSNGQVEKKYPNGTQDVVFPDGTVKQTYPDGMEVCTFVDGCVVTTSVNGDRVIEFPNGQKEMHTAEYKSRVYPNGIVRVVFKSGLCETRYPNGEVRRKYIRETTTNDLGGASGATSVSSQELPPAAACNP